MTVCSLPTPAGAEPTEPSATVSVVARALDLVVTYQDLKRIFATVKVFQAACTKSGLTTSSGVQWIASMMEREDEDPGRPPFYPSDPLPSLLGADTRICFGQEWWWRRTGRARRRSSCGRT
eukprot:3935803-Rhodomonas_salina.2